MTHKQIVVLAVFTSVLFYAIAFGLLETAHAGINVERLANAIYKAENSKAHPYGILQHYRHTTPRQACINTIRHRLNDYNREGRKGSDNDFIAYLGRFYAPLHVSNDPSGLNRFWIANVQRIYKGMIK